MDESTFRQSLNAAFASTPEAPLNEYARLLGKLPSPVWGWLPAPVSFALSAILVIGAVTLIKPAETKTTTTTSIYSFTSSVESEALSSLSSLTQQ